MSYVIKAVARPLEGEASVRIVGKYEDYDTAVRQRRAMDERCRVARGIILDYADIEFPVVRFYVDDGEINNNDFIDSYISYHVAPNTSPIDALREAVCNLEKSIEDKKRKLLSNGEIIELV